MYVFARNDSVHGGDVLGLYSVSVSAGFGKGLMAGGDITFSEEFRKKCPDGTDCWKYSLNATGYVGVGLGAKGKFKFKGRTVGVDLMFKGPNINSEYSTSIERKCNGTIIAGTKYEFLSFNNSFQISTSVGIGLISLEGQANVDADFAVAIETESNMSSVTVRLVADLEAGGSLSWNGIVDLNPWAPGSTWKDGDDFPLDPVKKSKTILTKTFP